MGARGLAHRPRRSADLASARRADRRLAAALRSQPRLERRPQLRRRDLRARRSGDRARGQARVAVVTVIYFDERACKQGADGPREAYEYELSL